jgi:hypothetical protein
MLWMRDPFGRPQSPDKSESRRTTDLPCCRNSDRGRAAVTFRAIPYAN